jgi:hypothetical protein
MIRSAQVLPQRKAAIHDLASPLFPIAAHSCTGISASLHHRYCKRAYTCAGGAFFKEKKTLVIEGVDLALIK